MLYIAMAGTHQIWSLDLQSGAVAPFAGTGREGLLDGPAGQAWFAQSSGLALSGGHLYVADSEVSAVRDIDLRPGVVTTIVGEDLFVFGDQDGEGGAVRLQHRSASRRMTASSFWPTATTTRSSAWSPEAAR